MESYKVVDDKTHTVLLETDETSNIDVWEFAYKQIKENPQTDVFIEVYEDGVFDHWCDPESVVYDYELTKGSKNK